MRIHLFLDLEETLINNFRDKELLETNIEKIKAFIKRVKPESVSIFSFAIHNQNDIACFEESGLARLLERLLEVKFKNIHQVDSLNRLLLRSRFTYLQDFEFISIFGKQNIFNEFVVLEEQDGFSILIDDVVKTQITVSGTTPKMSATINVLDIDNPDFVSKFEQFIGE